jgi:two-component system, NtrC family, nitrogen regulation response regulator NtrX
MTTMNETAEEKAPKILIVDDEKNIRTTLSRALDLEGFEVCTADTGEEALRRMVLDKPDIVLLDLKLPDISGLDVLKRMNIDKSAAQASGPPVIMMSGHGTLEAAIQATRLGATDFLEKPLEIERMLLTIRNGLKLEALDRQVGAFKRQAEIRHGMVGTSAALLRVTDAIRSAAPTKARVLIHGESGVGKELVAKAIHESSERCSGAFVKLNCAAISENLVESELFGHEKGAFTGAERRHQGRFERASQGTLFLDEIGEMPLATQARLLRVLQEGEFERVGGASPIATDARVIAATNRNLEEEVKAGRFRQDLYYRLNVIPIYVPALRERREDILELAAFLLDRSCREHELEEKHWSEGALRELQKHQWPGNIRELAHLTDRLAILTSGNEIPGQAVVRALPGAAQFEGKEIPDEGPLYQLLESVERKIIEERIVRFDGNMTKAAHDLGLERSHLYKKVRRLGISRQDN